MIHAKFSPDAELRNLAEKGLCQIRSLLSKIKQMGVAPAFRPVEIGKFTHPRPHFVWYVRRYEKKIFESMIAAFGLVVFFFLIIKNWK